MINTARELGFPDPSLMTAADCIYCRDATSAMRCINPVAPLQHCMFHVKFLATLNEAVEVRRELA